MKEWEYVVQGDYGYGYGWEDLTAEDSLQDARDTRDVYDANEPTIRHRAIRRAVNG